MSAALFPTITSAHWGALFAEARAEGVREGNLALQQIRAATRAALEKEKSLSRPDLPGESNENETPAKSV